jgi:hypothetical protein
MHKEPHIKLFTAIAVGLAVAVMAPIASATSSPQGQVKIPARLAHTQYPGSSSEPTVYMAGPITIPARLVRTQYPGSSSEPTVLVNVKERNASTGSNARTPSVGRGFSLGVPLQYLNTTAPTHATRGFSLGVPLEYLAQPTATVRGNGFDWGDAAIGAVGGLGIALAGAGGLIALRKRSTFAHA